jgi:2',3'-cyclic-nucleotide 2'-phosphodiesterase (5'-nucleotidase family)
MFSLVADGNLPGLDYIGGTSGEGTAREPVLEPLPLIQAEIDRLTNQGVNKIIFIDHAQDYTNQSVLPAELDGVDVIIQAGMTGYMSADTPSGPFNLLRTEEAGNPITHNFPLQSADSEGNTVLITNTEQIWRYVGHLVVNFDDNGEITSYDADNSGPVPTNDEGLVALRAWTSGDAVADPVVVSTYEALLATDELEAAFAEVGTTTDSLNGVRADIRSRETNLGRLAADSTLWYANEYLEEIGETKRADIALKNGGGIRDTIAGLSPITQLQVNAALAFDNQLTIMDLTGAEFLAIVENGVSRAPALDGRFPHFAGVELEFVTYRPGVEEALSLSETSRVANLIVTQADGNTVLLVRDFEVNERALEETFTLATNNYQAGGGDGYQAFVPLENKIETVIGEQEILATYIAEELGGVVDISDADVIASPRSVLLRPSQSDLVDPADEIMGTRGNDQLVATRTGSALQGLRGDDMLKGRKSDDLLDGGFGDDKLRGRGGADVYVGSAGKDKIMGFSFEEGDVIAIDESIGFEVSQPSNPERSIKIIHDAGTILVKGITADQAIHLENAIQITG